MLDFAALKKNSQATLKKLAQEVEKINDKGSKSGDDRFWKPTVDKAGNGRATIRFLPACASDENPWVRVFDHGFQGPGGWYIEKSLTTIGKEDPLGRRNSELWNSGIDANKEIARKQKRRLRYISNIYVINDPGKPENNGQVFLFSYGKKIWDKISSKMNPEFDDEEPFNPFDFDTGADFKLRVRQIEGYPNYDESSFDAPTPFLKGNESEQERVWKSEYALTSEFLDPKNFKSYAELEARMNAVLGTASPSSPRDPTEDDEHLSVVAPRTPKAAQKTKTVSQEEDEDMKYFRSLVDDE
jgi:hypothetical protein